MYKSTLSVILCFFLTTTLTALADNWPQWRGPARNGVATSSPVLASSWPVGGPTCIWKSDLIPSDKVGGFGSPAISGGKVYLYVNWKTKTPIPQRRFKEQSLRQMGWIPEAIPDDLRAAVETARISEERLKLKDSPEELNTWLETWVKKNVPEADQAILGRWASERLRRGATAYPFAMLDALATIRDREFNTPEELDIWFNEQKFSKEWKDKTLYWIPTTNDTSCDTVVCLDASNGSLLWKYEVPGRASDWGSSSTPCIVDGRCFVAGDSKAFCLDASTGKLIWSEKTEAQEIAASFIVLDGLAILPAKILTAFDAQTGTVRWTQQAVDGTKASPVLWQQAGKKYLICQGEKLLSCVEPATGVIIWSVPNITKVTPAIIGDDLVTFGNESKTGLRAYALSPSGATLRWTVPLADRSACPLIDHGYVYAIGGVPKTKLLCVSLATGALQWEQPFGTSEYSSPLLADGKILTVKDNGKTLGMVQAAPEKYQELAMFNLPITRFTSPALSQGRVVLRLTEALACYDLTAPPTPSVPAVP